MELYELMVLTKELKIIFLEPVEHKSIHFFHSISGTKFWIANHNTKTRILSMACGYVFGNVKYDDSVHTVQPEMENPISSFPLLAPSLH